MLLKTRLGGRMCYGSDAMIIGYLPSKVGMLDI